MIHGPCGTHNPGSPCMENGNCTMLFLRLLVADTISGIDGYPLYQHRSPDDNDRSIMMKVKGNDVVVDNCWIVPYCPLLSKTFSTHCNVVYYSSFSTPSNLSNTFANMWTKGVTWLCLTLVIQIQTMRWWNFNVDVTWVVMKQFGGYFHFRFINVNRLTYIW